MNTAVLSTEELIGKFGIQVEADLDRDAGIPVIAEASQRQGDVYIAYRAQGLAPATTPVPVEGVPVVRGENGGNTHLLLAATAGVFWDAAPATDNANSLALGTLTVEEGATAYLAHPEHGYNGFGAGTYEVKRQREMRDEITAVAD